MDPSPAHSFLLKHLSQCLVVTLSFNEIQFCSHTFAKRQPPARSSLQSSSFPAPQLLSSETSRLKVINLTSCFLVPSVWTHFVRCGWFKGEWLWSQSPKSSLPEKPFVCILQGLVHPDGTVSLSLRSLECTLQPSHPNSSAPNKNRYFHFCLTAPLPPNHFKGETEW